MWIMGLDFFTNYYMVFDHDNKKVGVALSINADQKLIDLTKESEAVEEMDGTAESSPSLIILIGCIVAVMGLSASALVKNMEKVKDEKKTTERKKDISE